MECASAERAEQAREIGLNRDPASFVGCGASREPQESRHGASRGYPCVEATRARIRSSLRTLASARMFLRNQDIPRPEGARYLALL